MTRAVVGIGCRKGASAEQIERAVALAEAQARGVSAMATGGTKRAETGLIEAGSRLGLPVVFVASADLAAAAPRAASRSSHVEAVLGLPSLAETAALAAAGPGSRLLAPRRTVGDVTFAVAVAE
ncbi:MAG TPA: cobalamin biosynthesis protein [Geminicoccaceae bacterium]|nr:cobalamin biosynthesis protein [Geminicoccus sp.]HMU51749.1 cobalamin biosynthesis protein [Geminicoccaceae bacterium]